MSACRSRSRLPKPVPTSSGWISTQESVAALARGESEIEDIPSERLAPLVGEAFKPTTDHSELEDCDAIVICVPTPLAHQREPDLSYVDAAGRTVSQILRPGQLVVLESTTYPGTTRDRLAPILEESDLKAGTDFHLAFSPERIDPGRTDFTVRTTPKVVGGLTKACCERATELYGLICDRVVVVSSPEVAEFTKLHENIFRSVNIALVNELAVLSNRMGIDVWEVVDAASSKPFGFMRFEPGPGMGGHCLPIDPFYLAFKAREYDLPTEFIELAGRVNQAQPHFCVERAIRALNDVGKAAQGSRILLLGVSYKAGIGDMRESPGLKIGRMLAELGAEVSYHDPHVPEVPELGLRSVPLEGAFEATDLVVIVTAHEEFDIEDVVTRSQRVLDFRGVTRGIEADNLVRL